MNRSIFAAAVCLAVFAGALSASAQVVVQDGFDSGILSSAWMANGGVTNGTTVQTGGGAAGTANYARLASAVGLLGARFDAVELLGSTNYYVDFYFRVQTTTSRQFNLQLSTSASATASGAIAVNLRYQTNQWSAYDGSLWQPVNGLGGVIAGQWYHLLFTGTNWGQANAAYRVSLSDAGGTNFTSSTGNLTWSQDGSITTSLATCFVFTTVNGSNPGFDVDQITAATTDSTATSSIPAGALSDPRYGLGYLVVTNYPGVNNQGTGDCQPGIQAALNDAFAANAAYQKNLNHLNNTTYNLNLALSTRPLAVFFPPGIYQISNILTCYQWIPGDVQHFGFNVLVGSTEGTRPTIKLAAGAVNYQSAASPWPMISFRCFMGSNGLPVSVPNPMSAPPNYQDWNVSDFYAQLRNIDFDCNSNPGAVGVVMAGAQGCGMENVKVSATNAFAGFYELPGAGSCSANLEVDGGQYGIIQGQYSSLGLKVANGTAGPTIAGVTLANQTVAALKLDDEVAPVTVAGFNIVNCSGVAVQNQNFYFSSGGTVTLLDGQIAMNSGNNPAAINNVGKNLYVRNVYVTGTTNLIISASTTTTGAGMWSQILEYSYNNPVNVANVPPNNNYSVDTPNLESYSVINGTIQNWTSPFPVAPSVVTKSGAPPMNLVSRHLWTHFPSYNGAPDDPPTVVVNTNAGWNNINDATATLQAAIDSASSSNATVFLPAGLYYITNTLILHTNTVLLGVGRLLTQIVASQSWRPTSGEVSMLQSDDSASATTTLADLTLSTRALVNATDTNYARFDALTWQAGGNSLIIEVDPLDRWTQWTNCQPRALINYKNHGGGHFYGLSYSGTSGPDGPGEGNPAFRIVRINGTTQPLWFYGFSIDYGNDINDERAELSGASNVRLLGLKEESLTPYLVMTNCTNIAAYGFGDAQFRIPTGNGFFQVLGNSTNILMGNLTVLQPAVQPQLNGNMLYEEVAGQPVLNVLWPNNVSLYKRGEINDTSMLTVPMLTITTAGNQTTLSWMGGGTLESANQVAGPYFPVMGAASPYTINSISDNASLFFRVVK